MLAAQHLYIQAQELEYQLENCATLECFCDYVAFTASAANSLPTFEYHPVHKESQLLIPILLTQLLLTLFSHSQLTPSSIRQEILLEGLFGAVLDDLPGEKGLES